MTRTINTQTLSTYVTENTERSCPAARQGTCLSPAVRILTNTRDTLPRAPLARAAAGPVPGWASTTGWQEETRILNDENP